MIRYEGKIIGINPFWISALLTAAFLIVCATGGENVNWGYLGFEVLFPFYMAIAIGEWCRTRSDVWRNFRTRKIPFSMDCTQISSPVCSCYGFCCYGDVCYIHHHKNIYDGRSASDFSADSFFSIQCMRIPLLVEQRTAHPYNGSWCNMALFYYVYEPLALSACAVFLSVCEVCRHW